MLKPDLSKTEDVENFVSRSFASDGRRLRHIEVVAQQVRASCEAIAVAHPELSLDCDLGYRAALLHDIGYLAELRSSGFHPRDGSRFIRALEHWRIADLIEGHSCSPEEAKLLGLAPVEQSEDLLAKLITYWDMRVKQGGEIVSYEERLADIISRYGATSLVGRANLEARPRLEKLFAEVDLLLAKVKVDTTHG